MLQKNQPLQKNNIQIIYEDENIVGVNKPAGLLTIPDRLQSEKSLKETLIEKYGAIYTVHRIDKDTSGLVLFAKNENIHKYLSQLFESRQVQKFYLGIVLGMPQSSTGIIDAPIAENPIHKGTMYIHRKGKPSQTSYQVLEANRHFSLVQFELHTGRTHQIRVHAKEIGHPLACDAIYGNALPVYLSSIKKKYKLSKNEEAETPIINRLALHAAKLNFKLQNGKQIQLETPVPKEFRALMQQLKKLY